MGQYKIVKPLHYVKGNKTFHHTRPGKEVTLDDDIAATLGDRVERLGAPPAPAGEPPADNGGEPAADGNPDAEAEAAAKPKSSRSR